MSPQQGTDEDFSAKRMALLQFYTATIQGLVIMTYRSDPVKYDNLLRLLHLAIRELEALGREVLPQGMSAGCDPGEQKCADGFCHPANDPTCCDINPADANSDDNPA